MQYEKPNLEIVLLQTKDIVTLSFGGSGDGENVDGDVGGWS